MTPPFALEQTTAFLQSKERFPMLDNLILTGGPFGSGTVDAGTLAESLIYYGRTRLVLKPGTITGLCQSIGRENFRELIVGGWVDPTIMKGSGVTHSVRTPTGLAHNFAIMTRGARGGGPMSDEEELQLILRRATERRGWSRRLAGQIVERADRVNLSDPHPIGVGVADAARTDIESPRLFRALFEHALRVKAPEFTPPPEWRCNIIRRDDGGYTLSTNVNLAEIQARHPRVDPSRGELTEASLIGTIIAMHEELRVQTQFTGDLQASELVSGALRIRLNSAIEGALRSRQQIDAFQESTMPSGRKLREAVNAGEVPFGDVLRLCEHRDQFAGWIRGISPSANLLEEYLAEVNRQPLLGRLPSKVFRYAMFSGLGAIIGFVASPSAGAVLNAAINGFDQFLYERLAGGWTPHQFVEDLYWMVDTSTR